MPDPAPTTATNADRSMGAIVHRATIARRTGRWPPWRWHQRPEGCPELKGWAKEVTRIAENGVFVVMLRDVETSWGKVTHAMIARDVLGIQPTWSERQRIKNEVLGAERTAVEVLPAMSQVVDGANAYHLWALPVGMELPFGLAGEGG